MKAQDTLGISGSIERVNTAAGTGGVVARTVCRAGDAT